MQQQQTLVRSIAVPARQTVHRIGYPTNRYLTVAPDWNTAYRVACELVEAGVEPAGIEFLRGDAGLRRLGRDGTARDIRAGLARRLPELGPERATIDSYAQHLRDDRVILMVRRPERASAASIEPVLGGNGLQLPRFFGRFAVTELSR